MIDEEEEGEEEHGINNVKIPILKPIHQRGLEKGGMSATLTQDITLESDGRFFCFDTTSD